MKLSMTIAALALSIATPALADGNPLGMIPNLSGYNSQSMNCAFSGDKAQKDDSSLNNSDRSSSDSKSLAAK